jgi:hypothetical protein
MPCVAFFRIRAEAEDYIAFYSTISWAGVLSLA